MVQVESISVLVVWVGIGVSLFVAGLCLLRSTRRGVLHEPSAASEPTPASGPEVPSLGALGAPATDPVLAAGDPMAG